MKFLRLIKLCLNKDLIHEPQKAQLYLSSPSYLTLQEIQD